MIDEMVDKAVVMGLHYAEEQAHKLRDNPVKGAEKLNMAADKALEYLKDSKVVDKGAEYIKGLIEAKLGQTRNNPPTVADEPETEDEKKPADK
jgi:dihydroxyacetone kinase-like predicted kinase